MHYTLLESLAMMFWPALIGTVTYFIRSRWSLSTLMSLLIAIPCSIIGFIVFVFVAVGIKYLITGTP